MENLPIDTKSLPSRIFHSETEDKVYVGEPGNYKEIGGNITLDDVIPPTANEFLVGNSAGTDWEKRIILPIDYNISNFSTFRVPAATNANGWINGGIPIASNYTPVAAALPRYTSNPDWGRLKANDAIESNDLVPLGQLEGMLDDIDLQKTLDNGNIADGVGIMLTDGSSIGQYTAEFAGINVGTTAVSMSKAEEGFLYAGVNGRVHLGDRDGVVGLNFETLSTKMNIVPPTSFGNATHTLQNKSGVIAHLSDVDNATSAALESANIYTDSEVGVKAEIGGDLGGTTEEPIVERLSVVAEAGKDQIPKVLPDGTIEGEDIMELWVYDDTTSPYTLTQLQTLYGSSEGIMQGFEVRCRQLTPPTTYRLESVDGLLWIKIEGSNVV